MRVVHQAIELFHSNDDVMVLSRPLQQERIGVRNGSDLDGTVVRIADHQLFETRHHAIGRLECSPTQDKSLLYRFTPGPEGHTGWTVIAR
jgi:hypothetical protein